MKSDEYTKIPLGWKILQITRFEYLRDRQGWIMELRDLRNFCDVYTHYQPHPNTIERGQNQAKLFLSTLASGAGLTSFTQLLPDCTTGDYSCNYDQIVGRVVKMNCSKKKMKKKSVKGNTNAYLTADSFSTDHSVNIRKYVDMCLNNMSESQKESYYRLREKLKVSW